MMLWKCCTQYASKFGNSAVATGLISFHWKDQLSFQTQRRAIPNCVQKTVQLHSFHALARRRQWQPTPALLPGKSHGQKGLVCCSPWGREESDMTEWLQFHFSFPCIGEGNDNQLQYSSLENPRDGGAWWADDMGSHRIRHDWSDLAAAAAAHTSKVMLKILQARLQQYLNCEFSDVQAGLRKAGNHRSNCQHLLDHQKS